MVIVHYEVDPCLCQIQDFCPRSKNHACCQHCDRSGPQTAPTSFPSSASHLLRLTHIPPAIGIFPVLHGRLRSKIHSWSAAPMGFSPSSLCFITVSATSAQTCRAVITALLFSPHVSLPVASVPGTGRNTSSSYHYRSSGSYPPCVRNSARYLHTP